MSWQTPRLNFAILFARSETELWNYPSIIMQTFRRPTAFILIFLFILAGCGQQNGEEGASAENSPTPDPVVLEGTAWQLVEITVLGGYVFTPEDRSRYNLRFRSENRLVGSSDCNRIGATWQHDGSSLTLEQFATTNDMCPPGTLHNHFVSNLMNVNSMTKEGERLVFGTSMDGVQLLFEPLAPGTAL